MHILGILKYYPSHTIKLVLGHISVYVCVYVGVIINDYIILLNAVKRHVYESVCTCVYMRANIFPKYKITEQNVSYVHCCRIHIY